MPNLEQSIFLLCKAKYCCHKKCQAHKMGKALDKHVFPKQNASFQMRNPVIDVKFRILVEIWQSNIISMLNAVG